jgi:hypothetical protein
LKVRNYRIVSKKVFFAKFDYKLHFIIDSLFKSKDCEHNCLLEYSSTTPPNRGLSGRERERGREREWEREREREREQI